MPFFIPAMITTGWPDRLRTRRFRQRRRGWFRRRIYFTRFERRFPWGRSDGGRLWRRRADSWFRRYLRRFRRGRYANRFSLAVFDPGRFRFHRWSSHRFSHIGRTRGLFHGFVNVDDANVFIRGFLHFGQLRAIIHERPGRDGAIRRPGFRVNSNLTGFVDDLHIVDDYGIGSNAFMEVIGFDEYERRGTAGSVHT